LASGSAATVTIIVSAPSSAQSISATAAVTGDQPDPDASNNSDTEATTVIDVLSVSSVTPNSGLPTGGGTVTLSGSGFLSITSVTFGGTPATSINVLSTTAIEAVVPSGSVASVDVVVSRSTGDVSDSFTVVGGYTYGFTFADLSVTITDSQDPAFVGKPVTYSIAVSNAGPLDATSVTLTVPLPSPANFGAATPSQGSCGESAGVVTCALGSIVSGGAATVSVVLTPTAFAFLSTTASISADQNDPTTSNNTATETTQVFAAAGVPGVTSWGLILLAISLAAAMYGYRRRRSA